MREGVLFPPNNTTSNNPFRCKRDSGKCRRHTLLRRRQQKCPCLFCHIYGIWLVLFFRHKCYCMRIIINCRQSRVLMCMEYRFYFYAPREDIFSLGEWGCTCSERIFLRHEIKCLYVMISFETTAFLLVRANLVLIFH